MEWTRCNLVKQLEDGIAIYNILSNAAINVDIENKNLYLNKITDHCPSLTKHHLLLDANGDIYNCWQVVGEVKYRIGTIFNGFTPPECELVETEQEECLHCKVYPICHTGCPLHYDELLENNCKYIPELLIKDIEEYIVSEK